MDVKSLNRNIPKTEGIAATKRALDKETKKTVNTEAITTFLALILNLNNFIFNCKSCIPTKGCAMGTISAPSYANTFMAEFESKYIYPLIKNMHTLYLRFTDDIFMIRKRTHDQLQTFLKQLSELHLTRKFDYKISKEETSFLDTKIYIAHNRNINTTVYRKETDCQSFQNSIYEHSLSLKWSIPYNQALRFKQICPTVTKFRKQSESLMKKFIERGYRAIDIKEKIDKTNTFDRKDLL